MAATAGISALGVSEGARRERCEEALPQITEIVDAAGRSSDGRLARYHAGVCQRALGDFEAAAASFAALRGYGDLLDGLATMGLAGVQRSAGDLEEAAASYRSLLDGRLDIPQDPVLYELALIEEAAGRPEAAIALYDRITDEHPTSVYRTAAEARRSRIPVASP